MKKLNKVLICLFVGINIISCSSLDQSIDNSELVNSEIVSDQISDSSNDDIIEDEIENSETTDENEEISNSEVVDDSIIESEDAVVGKDEKYYYFDKNIKLYINPSVQYSNLYAHSLGNEGEHMRQISIILTDMLKDHTNLIIYANNSYPGLSLKESVSQSNSYNVDYHISLHSNAGGGKGSEGWHSYSSIGITSSILTKLDEILPYKTRGLKNGSNSLYEIKNTKAKATLIEILFHDDKEQALFIVTNYYEIARAIFEGIIIKIP